MGTRLRGQDSNRFFMPRIVLALMTHSDVAGVQEKGCRALYNLSVSPENVRTIREEEPDKPSTRLSSLAAASGNGAPKDTTSSGTRASS